MEDEADRFAAEFLAPAAEIAPDLEGLDMAKLAHLKMQWGISMQALIMRAFHLGTISDRQRRSFFTRLTQLGYRKQEPYPIPKEAPTLVNRLIDFHQTEHAYTIEDLAAVTLSLVPEFRRSYLREGEPAEGPKLRVVN
jgi:Zn-dependent peptidase ImmA (M78 family)